jgi:hypothetical protein
MLFSLKYKNYFPFILQCQATNEEEIFEVQDKGSLLSLGWIHVSPTLGLVALVFVDHVYKLLVFI